MRSSQLLGLLQKAISDLSAAGSGPGDECLRLVGRQGALPFELRSLAALPGGTFLFSLTLAEARTLRDTLVDPELPFELEDIDLSAVSSRSALAARDIRNRKLELRHLASPERHGRRPIPKGTGIGS